LLGTCVACLLYLQYRRLFCQCSLLILSFLTSFFFNDTATTEIYTLSLHDALPISEEITEDENGLRRFKKYGGDKITKQEVWKDRSEEHTSELQSRENLVCRLLLEKKKKK